jgi:hypothetical protein
MVLPTAPIIPITIRDETSILKPFSYFLIIHVV